jgi:hypothetical protein
LIDAVRLEAHKRPVSDDWERMADRLAVCSFVKDGDRSAEKIAHTCGNMLNRRMS